jgi:hypothetical protein
MVVGLAACGNDEAASPPSSPGGSTTTTADDIGTDTVTRAGTGYGLLVRVRATAAGSDDVERVTFEFEDALPGYRVGYVDRPVIQDGSGEQVTVDGGPVLLARFEPASGFDLSGEGRPVFTGPERLDLATTTVVDVVRVGDFEAILQWAIGIDGSTRVPFRVVADAAAKTITVEVSS